MVINVATNMNKLQLEKNNFIKELSREQFDGVMISKYKKAFIDYFNGNIGDVELADKINSNLELIKIYENGENGKIDSNQYLYSAIVDVALNYYNVANGFETCMHKINLLASYFQLIASAESRMELLNALIYDVFFINGNLEDGVDEYLNLKLDHVRKVAEILSDLVGEIVKHEDVIADVEKESNLAFVDEIHIDESIKDVYYVFSKSARKIQDDFNALLDKCVNESDGAKLDILNGTLTGGA